MDRSVDTINLIGERLLNLTFKTTFSVILHFSPFYKLINLFYF